MFDLNALNSFLSNLIQGPNPKLVGWPHKHKSLISFRFSVRFSGLINSKDMAVKLVMLWETKRGEKDETMKAKLLLVKSKDLQLTLCNQLFFN